VTTSTPGAGCDPAVAGPAGMVESWSALRLDSGWAATCRSIRAAVTAGDRRVPPASADRRAGRPAHVAAVRPHPDARPPSGAPRPSRSPPSPNRRCGPGGGSPPPPATAAATATPPSREADLVDGRAVFRLVWTITVTAADPRRAGRRGRAGRGGRPPVRARAAPAGRHPTPGRVVHPAAVPRATMMRRTRRLAPRRHHPRRARAAGPTRRSLPARTRRARRDELAERRATAARYRRLGGRRGQRRRFAGRILFETLAPARSSCRPAPGGDLSVPGRLPPGAGRRDGDRPVRDRRDVHLRPVGPLRGRPAVQPQHARARRCRLGQVVAGQDAGVARARVRPRRPDHRPQGRVRPLAAAAGTAPIDLHPGGGVVLNPLDPGAAGTSWRRPSCSTATSPPAGPARSHPGRGLPAARARPGRRRLARVAGLDPTDLDGALRSPHGQTVTLPMLAEALIDPDRPVAAPAQHGPRRVVDESRELALAPPGSSTRTAISAGMFAGPPPSTPTGSDALTVVDIATSTATTGRCCRW
jgi:hypothetical protein